MGNSASSEQQQQQESTQQIVQSNTSNINNNNNTNTVSKTNSINIKQSKVSEEQSLNKDKTEYTTPSISYSSPLSPPIPGMMQQVVNNSNNSNSNNSNDNNNDNKTNDTSTTATTTIPTITTSTNTTTSTPNINTENIVTSSTSTPSTSDTTTTTLPKPVPGRSGWVSSTGSSSPWYGGGSLSSSASSTQPPQPYSSSYQQQNKTSHRQSISGPYYRARGMSINQQQSEPNDDELINQSSSVQPSPSTSQQLPRLQLQQLQINSPSLSSPVSATKSDPLPKEKSTPGIPTIITWSHGGNNVYVTGTFNGWKHKIQLVKSTHDFSTVVDLPIGTHRLKFIVDDEWKCSNEMETATDPDGNLVNYLQVLDEDDVEEDSDLFQRGTNEAGHDYGNNNEDDDGDQYTNIIPEELTLLAEAMQTAATDPHNMDQQKRDAIEWERKQPQPPCLPPHLEKVLLNSQNVSEEDNSVLPTPNHVTLNHLYACSIKDQVMALSTTTRYRKKYVTTMYYRPVQ